MGAVSGRQRWSRREGGGAVGVGDRGENGEEEGIGPVGAVCGGTEREREGKGISEREMCIGGAGRQGVHSSLPVAHKIFVRHR